MSKHVFDPQCPDCRPLILDPKTGEVLPPTNPFVQVVNRIWDESTREDQEALHRIWVHSSREPQDLDIMGTFTKRVLQATQS